ncbi:unnamed protein product [Closterium sp. NIES-53]
MVDDEDIDKEGDLLAREESTNSDVVEVPVEKEALASWKGEAVKAAMDEEIRSLIDMGTWELVERPRGVNIMKNRWVLTTKYRIDDTIERKKARLVVKGFTQVYVANYDDTYASLDMKNTFLQSKLDRVLYMYQPDYFDDGTGGECKMLKSLCGLKPSPLLWYRALDDVLLGVGWKKIQVDEALYFKVDDDGVTCWVLVYVDDLLATSSSTAMLKELKDPLEAAFELHEISPVVKYLGLEITLVSVDTYAELTFDDEEAQEREEEEYRQKVGSLQFAATTTRPAIAFACSKLGSGLTVRSNQHWCEVDRCLTYLADTRDTTLEFGGGPESLELIGYVDIDDAGDKQNRTSTGGYQLDVGKPTVLRVDNMVRCGKFVLKYIPTTEQPADFLTKALHFPAFNRCSVAVGQVRLADVGDGDDDVQ